MKCQLFPQCYIDCKRQPRIDEIEFFKHFVRHTAILLERENEFDKGPKALSFGQSKNK